MWPRKEGVPYPNTWDRFKGVDLMREDQDPVFWIEDLTEDHDEEVLQQMRNHFLRDGVLARATRLLQDPDAVQEALAAWRHMLRQRVSLVALTAGVRGKPMVVGCNIMSVRARDQEEPKLRSAPLRAISEAMTYIEGRVDVLERYGVERYLKAFGLSVAPAWRGQGIGLHLLRARKPLCRALALRLTATVFTGTAAQKQAARAGFQLLVDVPYAEYRDSEGRQAFAHAAGRSFMYMALPVGSEDSDDADVWPVEEVIEGVSELVDEEASEFVSEEASE